MASCGDRFIELRIDSNLHRQKSGTNALANRGSETEMRKELSEAIGGIVLHAATEVEPLNEKETERLLKAADVVTLARTGVERDYQGNVIDAHMPEMPTRFAKQLAQVVVGGISIGMTREAAVTLALRIAHDSIPPLRLSIMIDVAINPKSRPGDTRHRLSKPWRTTQREMEGLHMLGILRCDEEKHETKAGDTKTSWLYSLAENFDRRTLLAMAGISEEEAAKRREQTSPFKTVLDDEETDAQYRARVKAEEAALAKKTEDEALRRQVQKRDEANAAMMKAHSESADDAQYQEEEARRRTRIMEMAAKNVAKTHADFERRERRRRGGARKRAR
jgi:hypothetical protein